MLASLITEFGTKLMVLLIGLLVMLGGYLYWKHDVVSAALVKSQARLDEQTRELMQQKEEEIETTKKLILERTRNAIQIYADHFDQLNDAANRIPERVYINTKTNCSSNTLPGTPEDRSKIAGGTETVNRAELPDPNIRKLNETIRMIEKMQLKCEYILNTME